LTEIYLSDATAQWRCYQISDCHFLADPEGYYQGIQPFRHLERLLATLEPYPLILTGDLTQDHSEASYQLLADLLKNWPSPVFYLPGNHDDPALMAKVFAAAPFHSAKEIWCAGWQLLLLSTKGETPAGSFDNQRRQALTARLQDQPHRAAWLFCHHHPKPIGSSIDEHGLVESAEFCQLLDNTSKVKGLAHGHCHYAYHQPSETWQIVGCPASSVQFKLAPEWLTEDQGPQACLWQFAVNQQVQWEFVVV
jgi:Icc protein